MTTEELARRAQEILENEVFKNAVQDAMKQIQAQWLLSTEQTERESLWHKAQAINAVEGQLRKFRDAGIVAQHAQKRGNK